MSKVLVVGTVAGTRALGPTHSCVHGFSCCQDPCKYAMPCHSASTHAAPSFLHSPHQTAFLASQIPRLLRLLRPRVRARFSLFDHDHRLTILNPALTTSAAAAALSLLRDKPCVICQRRRSPSSPRSKTLPSSPPAGIAGL